MSSFRVPLVAAAAEGDEPRVVALLKQGADVNATDDGDTALGIAVIRAHTHVAQLLLSHGADPDLAPTRGRRNNPITSAACTFLEVAATEILDRLHAAGKASSSTTGCDKRELGPRALAMQEVFRACLRAKAKKMGLRHVQGAGTARRNSGKQGADRTLVFAVRRRDLPGVRKALANRADPNTLDYCPEMPMGVSVLALAASQNAIDIMTALLVAGADPNLTPDDGISPIVSALSLAHIAALVLLLAAGADPARGPGAESPLLLACSNPLLMCLVLAAGAPVDEVTGLGYTTLVQAVLTDDIGAAGALLGAGADPEAVGIEALTPLMIAAGRNQPEVVGLLLDYGANTRVQTPSRGLTPLLCAAGIDKKYLEPVAAGSREECVKMLLEAGAGQDGWVDRRDCAEGMTTLMQAADRDCHEVVQLLVAAGADVNLRNDRGMNALQLACRQGAVKSARLLLEAGASMAVASAAGQGPEGAGKGTQGTAMSVADSGVPAQLLQFARVTGMEWLQTGGRAMTAAATADLEGAERLSPLTLAAHVGVPELEELLVAAGADPADIEVGRAMRRAVEEARTKAKHEFREHLQRASAEPCPSSDNSPSLLPGPGSSDPITPAGLGQRGQGAQVVRPAGGAVAGTAATGNFAGGPLAGLRPAAPCTSVAAAFSLSAALTPPGSTIPPFARALLSLPGTADVKKHIGEQYKPFLELLDSVTGKERGSGSSQGTGTLVSDFLQELGEAEKKKAQGKKGKKGKKGEKAAGRQQDHVGEAGEGPCEEVKGVGSSGKNRAESIVEPTPKAGGEQKNNVKPPTAAPLHNKGASGSEQGAPGRNKGPAKKVGRDSAVEKEDLEWAMTAMSLQGGKAGAPGKVRAGGTGDQGAGPSGVGKGKQPTAALTVALTVATGAVSQLSAAVTAVQQPPISPSTERAPTSWSKPLLQAAVPRPGPSSSQQQQQQLPLPFRSLVVAAPSSSRPPQQSPAPLPVPQPSRSPTAVQAPFPPLQAPASAAPADPWPRLPSPAATALRAGNKAAAQKASSNGGDSSQGASLPTLVRQQRQLMQQQRLHHHLDIVEDSSCIVCMERGAVVSLLPCGHRELCEECSQQIHFKAEVTRTMVLCPTCRSPIEVAVPYLEQ